MRRSAAVVAGFWLSVLAPMAAAQDTPPPAPVREIHVTGAREISSQAIQDALRVRIGEPLIDTTEHLGEIVSRHYRDEGYTFARVKTGFDAASGVLSFDIDEGMIDGVVFQGVDEKLARLFEKDFALRAGDVFNRRRARQALDVLLRPTRGSVVPGRIFERPPGAGVFSDSRDLEHSERRGPFDLVTRDGQRVLLVGLREPPGRFRLVPDFGDREDWFTSVDGFVPSLGFGAAVFDHRDFNHSYVAGHLSYKAAAGRAGYA